jgi:hypothetical protein
MDSTITSKVGSFISFFSIRRPRKNIKASIPFSTY